MKRKIFVTYVCVMACSMLCSCGLLPTEEEFQTAPMVKEYEGNEYNKYTVVRGDMVEKENIDVEYEGTEVQEFWGEGSANRIKEICVKKGDKVEAGDILFRYYMPEQEKIVKDSERQIAKLELEMKQAKELMALELEKLEKTGGSKAQKDNIKTQYGAQITNCETSLELVRLDLKQAKEDIELEDMTADIDGTVTYVDKSLEDGYAGYSDIIVTVQGAKRNRFYAETEYANRFKDGQEVTILVSSQEYRTKVKRSSQKDVLYFKPITTLSIADGTRGTATLILRQKKDVLYLPAALVYELNGKHMVYMENENKIKVAREVTIGERMGNIVEVTGGIEENEQIVTD